MRSYRSATHRRELQLKCGPAADWIAEIWGDDRYGWLREGRNPLTHARLTRTVSPSARAMLHLPSGDRGVRELVTLARDFTAGWMANLFDRLDSLFGV
jgi:hypothetical protein